MDGIVGVVADLLEKNNMTVAGLVKVSNRFH
jgi:hypothetical protein